jgi:hypothetical protein
MVLPRTRVGGMGDGYRYEMHILHLMLRAEKASTYENMLWMCKRIYDGDRVWLRDLAISAGYDQIADKQHLVDLPLVDLLARIIYAEQTNAAGQGDVAWTIINRVLSNAARFVVDGSKYNVNIYNVITKPLAY